MYLYYYHQTQPLTPLLLTRPAKSPPSTRNTKSKMYLYYYHQTQPLTPLLLTLSAKRQDQVLLPPDIPNLRCTCITRQTLPLRVYLLLLDHSPPYLPAKRNNQDILPPNLPLQVSNQRCTCINAIKNIL